MGKLIGKKLRRPSSGVTLVEVLIYIGILAAVLSALIIFTFNILNSADQIDRKILVEQEGQFLLEKINWAITGAGSVDVPLVNQAGSVLSLNNGQNLEFKLSGQFLSLNNLPLSSQNVTVTNFAVSHSLDLQNNEKVEVSFNVGIAGDLKTIESFSYSKYLRQ